ncbi:NPB protein, partial [Chauna torquata]|nr:NPB protein [Chauna torquata]
VRAARWLALLCRAAAPRYKQAAGPRCCSVGRASALLPGLRRSPYIQRSDTDGAAERRSGVLPPGPARVPARLRTAALCVTDVAPEPRSCRVLPGVPSTLQCKADVTVSLDLVECADA